MGTYWGYLGVDMDHLSFLQYVNMLWLYVNHGAWIPDKTSNELTTGLLECFRKMGGEIWMNCTATEILFDENKAVRGVKTTCGEVETRHILCNMNQNMVYATMCPPEVVPERMVKLGNARTYSARMFVVYLGLGRSAFTTIRSFFRPRRTARRSMRRASAWRPTATRSWSATTL